MVAQEISTVTEAISVPVRSFVKKVLLGIYGQEPIHAGMYSAIGRELQEAYSFLPADELYKQGMDRF